MGSSRIVLQAPIFQSLLPFPTSSSPTSCRPSGGYSQKRAGKWKMSAMKAEDTRDSSSNCKRRALLLVGISAIPFLKLPALAAVDGLEKG